MLDLYEGPDFMLLDKNNFRSCHVEFQCADITHSDSNDVIARVKSIKL